MSFSKELKRELDNRVKKLINVFKKEFNLIKNRPEYNDHRRIDFTNLRETQPPVFSFAEEEEEEGKYPEGMRVFASIDYKVDKIVISINYREIYQGGFFRTTTKIFLKNQKFYEKVVKQIARHEYGHSFLSKTEFDSYPKEVRDFLKEIKCDDIFEVPENKIDELKETFRNSDYGKIDKILENIQLDSVEKMLKEFHADYSANKKIDNTPPLESLKLDVYAFQEGLSDLPKWQENFYHGEDFGVKELSQYFFFLLILTQIFYVYNSWNLLKAVFKEFNLEKLLGIFHILNQILYKIVIKSEKFDGMRKYLYELAKILDSLHFEKLFFENDLDQENLALLKNYIQTLKN